MSGLVMGLVWELEIGRDITRPEKYVLLAYADHADQAGGNIYPSVELIALKTGYKERAVQMITRALEVAGYLVDAGMGQHGTNRWRIPIVRTPEGGAKIAPLPLKNAPPEMSKNAPEGFAPEGFAPEPSVVVLSTTTTTGEPKTNEPEPDQAQPQGVDPRFGELVRLMESIYGTINMATGRFLDEMLKDWEAHFAKLNPNHPDRLIDQYTAVRDAIQEAINSAQGGRPNNKYIRAVFDRWMRDGYKSKRPGAEYANKTSPTRTQRKPADSGGEPAAVAADDPAKRAAIERINADRRARQSGMP